MKTMGTMLTGMLAWGLAACGPQSKTEGYLLQGEVADMTSGTIYLKCYRNGAFENVDSATVQEGHFTFQGTAGEPLAYALTTNPASRRPLTFFMGNEQVTVRLNESERQLQVTGAADNDEWLQLQEQTRNENYTVDSLLARHAASPVGVYAFLRTYSSRLGYAEVKAFRERLDASLEGSAYVKEVDTLLAKLERLQDGAEAPDFTLPDAEGRPVSLSSFRGQYVLVDFWAAWCPDCRRENPNVVAAYKQYQKKNFTVLGVSLDRDKDKWLEAIEKDGLTWTQVCDFQYWSGPVVDLYAVKWIPKSFLIGPDGRILASGLEGQALLDKLAEVVK